jgi:quercetin dioxygenase-like cupin family protein
VIQLDADGHVFELLLVRGRRRDRTEHGVTRRVAKGDFIMVPENTPHWFSAIDGTVVLMSLHLPHAPKPTAAP